MSASLPLYPTPFSQLQHFSTPRLTQALSNGIGPTPTWLFMCENDLDIARALIDDLGGELNGSSVYLDESTELVAHHHVVKLLPLLSSIPQLSIGISDSKITDETLEYIADFANVADLCLTGTAITDDGVKALSKLTNLTGLILNETSVSDVGVGHLSSMTKLKRLGLGPNVTDASAGTILTFRNLRWLTLEARSRCQITDQMLLHLKTELNLRIALGGSDPKSQTEYI